MGLARVNAYHLRGLAMLAMGDRDEATAALRRALSLAEAVGNPAPIISAHQALAKLYQEGGRDSLAKKHAGAGREIIARLAENLGDRTLLQRLTIP